MTSAAHSLKAPFPLLPSGDCWRSCRCSYASGQKAAWIGSEAAKAVLKYWKMETEADALALSICRAHKILLLLFCGLPSQLGRPTGFQRLQPRGGPVCEIHASPSSFLHHTNDPLSQLLASCCMHHNRASVLSDRQCQTYAMPLDNSEACPLLTASKIDQTSQSHLCQKVF